MYVLNILYTLYCNFKPVVQQSGPLVLSLPLSMYGISVSEVLLQYARFWQKFVMIWSNFCEVVSVSRCRACNHVRSDALYLSVVTGFSNSALL